MAAHGGWGDKNLLPNGAVASGFGLFRMTLQWRREFNLNRVMRDA
jgi:hypothetical protein